MGRGSIRIDGVLDIECAVWDKFVCGAMYSPTSGHRTFRKVGEFVDELLRRGGWWWAWSGGTYDFLAIAKELDRRGLKCLVHLAGSRASRLECGNLKLCDAYALIPLDLDSACEMADERPVGPLGWRCSCGQQCGGYCRISTHLSESRLRELEGYCVEDCRKGYRVLASLLGYAAEHGIELRGTIGGSAWATAKAWLDLPTVDWHWSTWRRVQAGNYGGRIVAARTRVEGGAHWDVSSSYPAALARTPLPVGEPIELGHDRAGLAYAAGTPGIYHCRVDVPESFLPPLPYRLASGTVAYPFGELVGSWPATELEAAEARGVEILEVISAVVWEEARVLFDEFVDWGWKERARFGKDSAWGRWLRLWLNALPGKFIENPERQGVIMNPDFGSVFICDGKSERSRKAGCCVEFCTERCGRWKPMDPWGRIWGIPLFRIGAGAHAQWGSYVTAAARLQLLEGMEAVGDGLVHAHTDSIRATSGEPDNTGDELGQWQYKGMFGDYQCWGPNAMQYVDGNTGEVVCRVAGLSRQSDRAWITEREKDIVDARGVLTFREAAAGGNLFKARTRVIRRPDESGWRGDRIVGTSDGRTYPVDRGTLERRHRPGGRQATR